MRRKRKTIVKIGRLLNLKRFICKKAQFVIDALFDWKPMYFLSIGVMCSNFDVFVTTTSQSILYALYFVQVSLRNAIVE